MIKNQRRVIKYLLNPCQWELMILELCRVSPDLLHLPVLLEPELSQLIILLVLWDGHVLWCLVHAWLWAAILHPLVHLHHALHPQVPCQNIAFASST